MAKRKYSAKRTKMEPAVMTVTTNTPTVPGVDPVSGEVTTGSFTLDLSQIASLINRRFYRQGINWAVSGFKVFTSPGVSGQVSVKKLPNTWVTSNAWEKAFRAWNKQQMDAIEDAGSESAVARFRDFKVFADETHVTAGFGANLLPLDGQLPVAQPYATGEWEESQIVIPNNAADASGSLVNPTEFTLRMCGVDSFSFSKGIIQGYAASRAYPQSPDPVSPAVQNDTNWFKTMFDVGNDDTEVLDNATNRNDNLPYPQADYPGGGVQAPTMQIHDIVGLSATTIGGTSRLKGGTFPCGLIRFDFANTSSTTSNIAIQIDLVPGTHRGYMCEPMTEM